MGASLAKAQDVSVYSEFMRIDPFGKPLRTDRGASAPREILSPAIARNAYTSFHIVVEGRNGDPYTLQVAQNPDNAVRVSAYRERYVHVGNEWVPDELELVTLPYEGKIGAAGVPNQTAQSFWLDLFADRDAAVRRIKVEPQVYIGDGWLRYPMEVRVSEAALGAAGPRRTPAVADVSAASAVTAIEVWRTGVCGLNEKKSPDSPLSIRSFIARNALQDIRLAGGAPPPSLMRLAGAPDRVGFCQSAKSGRVSAEDYLLVRDALVGARE